jgi:hypothetical protein
MRKLAQAALAASMLLMLALPPVAARAQSVDLTGAWAIQMQTVTTTAGTKAVVRPSCGFQGDAVVSQSGSALTGNMTVTQNSTVSCPSSMSASLTGTVTGNTVSMGAVMGVGTLGQASFTGIVAARAAGTGNGITGSFSVTGGPFTGTGGTFSATRLATTAATVPALGGRGMTVLALLLLAAAIAVLWRRPALGGPR